MELGSIRLAAPGTPGHQRPRPLSSRTWSVQAVLVLLSSGRTFHATSSQTRRLQQRHQVAQEASGCLAQPVRVRGWVASHLPEQLRARPRSYVTRRRSRESFAEWTLGLCHRGHLTLLPRLREAPGPAVHSGDQNHDRSHQAWGRLSCLGPTLSGVAATLAASLGPVLGLRDGPRRVLHPTRKPGSGRHSPIPGWCSPCARVRLRFLHGEKQEKQQMGRRTRPVLLPSANGGAAVPRSPGR